MKYRTETVRVGERTGDIDWSYDFRSHFNNMCTSDERRDEACAEQVQKLRDLEAALKAGQPMLATSDTGCPRFGWFRVLDVGMYDGWPYWRPVPSVLVAGPLSPEWKTFEPLDIEAEKISEGRDER